MRASAEPFQARAGVQPDKTAADIQRAAAQFIQPDRESEPSTLRRPMSVPMMAASPAVDDDGVDHVQPEPFQPEPATR